MSKKKKLDEKRLKTGERRQFLRYSCKTALKAILDFNPIASEQNQRPQQIEFLKGEMGSVLNISEKGMAIELDHILPGGLLMKIAIENPATPPIETDARVVWADRLTTKSQGYIIGMEFRHMKEKHQRNLQRLIQFFQNIPE